MKTLRNLILVSCLSCVSWFTSGCGTILRTQNDEVNQYAAAGGKKIRGPRAGVGPITFTLFSVDTGLNNSTEEPAVVTGATVLSKAGVKDLQVTVNSTRGGTNTHKMVGWGASQASTDVSTNAAPTIEAGGKAGGQLLNKSVTGN